ncbi:DSD1 family PLP-dependent enzyme [Bradyrhizobium canariense]|uniref:D-serine deaminase, pyridoxal phosphate-dependent n=1 Tax=Bradyrhizobium canariense TaxID=255045 RepID=A0A1H2B6H9_9BRAD|nr:DSD1 family PLP-dependent enzyme [Bradyrhizobium canariense]SDT53791.1 D-serine deaminase, pyridoxal phosphate-dependent [Bradyrhizobium canariense]
MLAVLQIDTILREVDTPALVVDLGALGRNIEKMAAIARRSGVSLRPHAKTHKSVEIARLQIGAGALGIACATVGEVEMLTAAGIPNLLLTAPVVDPAKFARLAALNRTSPLTIALDHVEQVRAAAEAIALDQPPLSIVVDTDVGQARTGVTSVAEGVALARAIASHPQLRFAGIQGFAGNAQHIPEPLARSAAAEKAAAMLRDFAAALAEVNLRPTIVTGGGTGTHVQDSVGPYTELQVGSYIFMDADYARIVDETGAGLPFEPSLFVMATVVSVNRANEVTVDAGTKALATNGPPPCKILGVAGRAAYRFAGDEHGILTFPDGVRQPALGQRVLLGASHCDPTINLHAFYHVVEEAEMQIWPIAARYGWREAATR